MSKCRGIHYEVHPMPARRRRRQRRTTGVLQKPWQIAERQFAPADILSADQVEELHRASLEIMQRTGIHFMGQNARDFLAGQPGVEVDEAMEIVRFDPQLVEQTIAQTPRSFRIHARSGP